MLKTITLVVIALFLFQPLVAQTLTSEFGVVRKDDLALAVYEKDPEAEAVVLFDVGESVFFDTDRGYDIRFTRTKRIKIFNKAGVDYAEVSIPFYVDGFGKTEIIISIEAYSYNLVNGALVKKELDKAKVYEERINDRWRAKKFVFPDVKEGSVIEYKYVLQTPFHFNLPDWEFQDRIPTIYSQYTAKLIPFYEYVFLAQGISKFDFQESKPDKLTRSWGSVGGGLEFKDMIHTYVMKDVPAFRDEAFITSPNDYLAKIDFQLAKFNSPRGGNTEIITTWPALNKELLKHQNFGKYTKSAEKLAAKILETEINTGQKNSLEKSKQIIEYVKASFSWNGSYSKTASKSPKEFLNQKSGNAADINLFLIAMLRAAGVDAQPVILSTRNHGKIKSDYPFEHFFNYVIVLVNIDKHAFLADGTEALIAFNRIPPRCINEKGLVVIDTEVKWVDLHSSIQSLENKNISLTLDTKSLKAKAGVTIQATEFEALDYRNSFNNDSTKIKESLTKSGISSVSRINTYNYDKANLPYIISYEGETSLERIDNKIVVSPFLNFPIKENKLTQKKRAHPVDFIYSKKETLTSVIDIPKGFKVVSIPEEYMVNSDLAEISLKYNITDNVIEAVAHYHFKKSLYISAEYDKIKLYFDMMVKKFNEEVVFEEM